MNIASKIYCRIFQGAFRTALPVLPYREPEIISSCSKLDIVFKKEKPANSWLLDFYKGGSYGIPNQRFNSKNIQK